MNHDVAHRSRMSDLQQETTQHRRPVRRADTVHLRITPDLRAAVERLAAQQERSFSAQARYLLASALERETQRPGR
jgi:hypothetical protein